MGELGPAVGAALPHDNITEVAFAALDHAPATYPQEEVQNLAAGKVLPFDEASAQAVAALDTALDSTPPNAPVHNAPGRIEFRAVKSEPKIKFKPVK